MSPYQRRDRWGFTRFPESKPRRVEGGIKARTARGEIGSSWWSKRFILALESLAVGGRLARGRSYARAGQVMALQLSAGEVRSTVQGSRPAPYRVALRIEPFTELVWSKVEIALAEQAIYSARLLAGEMPPDIEEVFAAAGSPLFPSRRDDLEMSCSCPDWEVPCKHLAATIYLLGERFDADPFEILAWRGRDRQALLARLRVLRGTEPQAGPAATTTDDASAVPSVVGAAAALADLGESAGSSGSAGSGDRAGSAGPVELERFWLSPVPLPVRPGAVPVPVDLLLRQLPPPSAALGGPPLVDRLRPAYARFAEANE
jgi:uncharacterized Zn finger protein